MTGQRMRAILLVVALLLVCSSQSIQAQQPGASVNLDCAGPLNIDVYPGSTKSGVITCTVENPTSFTEKIDIEVDSSNLSHAAPGSIHVGPGESEDFQISVRADEGMLAQSLTLTVQATVVEISGAPPPNVAQDEEEEVINILQYADVAISAGVVMFSSNVGEEFSIEFTIQNDGNSEDTLQLTASGPFDEDMKSAGYTVSFPSNNIRLAPGASETVAVQLKAPNQVTSNAYQVDSVLQDMFGMEISVTSEFSCKDSGCISESLNFVITLEEEFVASNEAMQDDTSSGEGFASLLGGDSVTEEIGVASLVVIGVLFFISTRKPPRNFE